MMARRMMRRADELVADWRRRAVAWSFEWFGAGGRSSKFCRTRRRFGDDIERSADGGLCGRCGQTRMIWHGSRMSCCGLCSEVENGEELEPKELRRCFRALAAYERNRISEAKEDAAA